MSDFFIKLLKLTERDEDTFTECLATTLAEDPDLRSRFVATLCGDEVDGILVRDAELLKSQPLPHGGDARVSKIDVRARKEPDTVIEVATPLRQLLGDAPDTESIAQRLAEFVLAVFDRVG